MRRSLLCQAARRLTAASPRDAASSIAGASGVAGNLLQSFCYPSHAAAAITSRSVPAYGLLSFGASLRPFSASAFSRAGDGLHEVLRNEYKQEVEQDEGEAIGNPPNSFKVVDTPGSAELVLEQKKGAETIAVLVDVEAAEFPSEDDDKDGDQARSEVPEEEVASLGFTVTVKRADKPGTLTFHCYTHGEEDCFEITEVLLSDDVKGVDSDHVYSGPRFDELDPEVLDAFHMYLKERGVDRKLVKYLEGATWDKEQKEYTRWLKRVGDFVKA